MIASPPQFRGHESTEEDLPSLDIPALAALLQAANRCEEAEDPMRAYRNNDHLLREADEVLTMLPERMDAAQKQAVRASLVKLFELMEVLD